MLICMQSNSSSGLESHSRVENNVSEISDCIIAEEQGHNFTCFTNCKNQLLRVCLQHCKIHCFTYKLEDQDPDGVNSRAVHCRSLEQLSCQ